MATVTESLRKDVSPFAPEPKIVLHDVTWGNYLELREPSENDHIRMTYSDGVLELMSPGFRHESGSFLLGTLVLTVCAALRIPCKAAASTTLWIDGGGTKKGAGTEPDQSFYIAHEGAIRGRSVIDLRVDPPPDLAIEYDDTNSSQLKLAAYAALGVPEVWIEDVGTGTIRFLGLTPSRIYTEIPASIALPMLSLEGVRAQLSACRDVSDSEALNLIMDWARAGFPDS